MKRILLLSIFLISISSFHLFAQAPSDRFTQAYNGILIVDALGLYDRCLDVPVYLNKNTNSSRVYKWYKARESFGVKAKSSETPFCSIECVYTNGKLTNIKLERYVYTIEWNSDLIRKITRYNSYGNEEKSVLGSTHFHNQSPVSFYSQFYKYFKSKGKCPIYDYIYLTEIKYNSYGSDVRGRFYDIYIYSNGEVSFREYNFDIKKKGKCSIDYNQQYKAYPTYYIDFEGKISNSDAGWDGCLNSGKYIKEVETIY